MALLTQPSTHTLEYTTSSRKVPVKPQHGSPHGACEGDRTVGVVRRAFTPLTTHLQASCTALARIGCTAVRLDALSLSISDSPDPHRRKGWSDSAERAG